MNGTDQVRASSEASIDAATLLKFLDREIAPSGQAHCVMPLGLQPLDRVLGGGLRRHDLLVLGGRPGVGKTVASLQVARNLALNGATVVFACYEHTPLTLLTRLLATEIAAAAQPQSDWYRADSTRALLDRIAGGSAVLSATSGDPMMSAARARLSEYAHRLHLVQATSSTTGLPQLADLVDRVGGHGPVVLIVDYLQKVRPGHEATTHLEHVAQITSGLKELSLKADISIVAVGALSNAGLRKRRVHLSDLDSAVAVGYDADVVILMNDKRSIISETHVTLNADQADRLRKRVVFTIEKNRGGIAPIDVEFTKEFEHFRFDPAGSHVAEQLIDESYS